MSEAVIHQLLRSLNRHKGDWIAIVFVLFAIWFIGKLDLKLPVNGNLGEQARAEVLSVNDDFVAKHGVLNAGIQYVNVRILDGQFAGRELIAHNYLRSQMELDKLFREGDEILVALRHDESTDTLSAIAQDYYNLRNIAILLALFAGLLLLFGGLTGLKALVTFLFSCAVVWQLLIPLCLKGYNPIWLSFVIVSVLSAVIIFLVAGIRAKGWTAFLGAIAGIFCSCALALFFTVLMKINGAVLPRSQPLFFAGFEFLNLTDLFIGALFLASSGAVMDLAMDVATGMAEIVRHKPEISRKALLGSGLRIGRAVVGTMSTTLLLAYTGGYITLMMSYQGEGIPMKVFLNYPYVVPEVLKTLVGSIGLILVAPLTALIGCWLLKRPGKQKKHKDPEQNGGNGTEDCEKQ